MANKIALLLFTTTVLLTSFAAMVIPQANALTNSIDKTNVTNRFDGHLKVCGSHICAPGEKTFWEQAVWSSQDIGSGKVGNAMHGEVVMHQLAGSTAGSTTSHGNTMPMNGNMTGNMPPGTK